MVFNRIVLIVPDFFYKVKIYLNISKYFCRSGQEQSRKTAAYSVILGCVWLGHISAHETADLGVWGPFGNGQVIASTSMSGVHSRAVVTRLHVPNIPARMAETSQPDWSREIATIGVANYGPRVAADQFGHLFL